MVNFSLVISWNRSYDILMLLPLNYLLVKLGPFTLPLLHAATFKKSKYLQVLKMLCDRLI
jgi:hypothetical protein